MSARQKSVAVRQQVSHQAHPEDRAEELGRVHIHNTSVQATGCLATGLLAD